MLAGKIRCKVVACAAASALLLSNTAASALPASVARAFGDHCFSPFLTATKAAKAFAEHGARHDFYDLDPFSDAAPSPVTGLPATPHTNRRCEVAFDGEDTAVAIEAVENALQREKLSTAVSVPPQYNANRSTALLAARQLNPTRIAVVEVGTRPGPNGIETYMRVERLAVDPATGQVLP